MTADEKVQSLKKTYGLIKWSIRMAIMAQSILGLFLPLIMAGIFDGLGNAYGIAQIFTPGIVSLLSQSGVAAQSAHTYGNIISISISIFCSASIVLAILVMLIQMPTAKEEELMAANPDYKPSIHRAGMKLAQISAIISMFAFMVLLGKDTHLKDFFQMSEHTLMLYSKVLLSASLAWATPIIYENCSQQLREQFGDYIASFTTMFYKNASDSVIDQSKYLSQKDAMAGGGGGFGGGNLSTYRRTGT